MRAVAKRPTWPCRPAIASLMIALALLPACDRNPFWVHQPEPEVDAAMLYLPDRAGIIVLPIEGVGPAQEQALSAALVEALQHANIPAGSGAQAGNARSQMLSTRVRTADEPGDDVSVELTWKLVDYAGSPLGEGRETQLVPSRSWDNGDDGPMDSIASRIAPDVASLVQIDMGEERVAEAGQRVRFAGLADAPGDGGRVVPPLIKFLLDKNGYVVTEDSEGAFEMSGHYDTEPTADGMESIAIEWRVSDPEGEQIGVVTQENVVPRGALDGNWGEAAYFIAEGAVQGVLAILVTKADTDAAKAR